MNSPIENYQKYKWFLTSTKKLVIGGKSAEQNDEILKHLKSKKEDYIVMHTHAPGSPFSIILAPIEKVSKSDLEETAIFTASFSRAWKLNKKKAVIDIFKLSSLSKSKLMKTGTWGVKGDVKHKQVELELVLTTQKDILRAVPPTTPNKKSILLNILPGKIDKRSMVPKLAIELKKSFNQEAILSALPPGGVKILRERK